MSAVPSSPTPSARVPGPDAPSAPAPVRAVHVIVPDSIDDPDRPSGGNQYDRRMCSELAALGWTVHVHPLAGTWPRPDAAARSGLDDLLSGAPTGATVLIDGLIASAGMPDAALRRLRVIVLVHMPLGMSPVGRRSTDSCPDDVLAVEGAVLAGAAGIITTSEWTKIELIRLYGLSPSRLHVAWPGVDAAEPTAAWPGGDGGNLLVVGAVTPVKGHDILVAALAETPDVRWRCVCVGSLKIEPEFVADVREAASDAGIAGRIRFTGAQQSDQLDADYAAADVVIVCSRVETYCMVLTEALARAIPVIAPDVGGVPEALGHGAGAVRPGILVPPGDPAALAAALRGWLGDAALRSRLRRSAGERSRTLEGWPAAGRRLSDVIAGVAAEVVV